MSDVLIRQLQRNIETLELLESEYAKRVRPRARLLSIRSALNNAIIALKKTKASYEESAKEQQVCEWIPVSERLPKPRELSDYENEKEYYLVQRDNGKMEVAEYLTVYDTRWFLSDTQECKNVIAWKPLPEPYTFNCEIQKQKE